MSITNYVKPCTKVVAGNDHKVYIAPISEIDAISLTENEVSEITLDSVATGFSTVEADLDTVGFNSSGTAGRGFFSEQTLTMMFSQKTPELITLIDELRDGVVCGLVVIRKDGNGKYFLSGFAPDDEMGGNRPYLSVETNFNSGASIEEAEEGNRYEVNLSRMSATEEYKLDSILSDSIDAGTATFIS